MNSAFFFRGNKMKKIILVILISLFSLSGIFSKDLTFTKNISKKEIDRIEFSNCTRYSDLKGYVACSTDKAVGFYLKHTGDKYTASIGDWKNISNTLTIVLFDVDFNVELRIHTDGDNVYIAIVEQVKE